MIRIGLWVKFWHFCYFSINFLIYMKKLPLFLLTISISLLFNSCGTQQTIALKPDVGVAKKSTLPLSSINLPISINCLAIENNINKQFNGILYNDESFENNNNDNLIIKITKTF